MERITNWPVALLRRWLLSAAVGGISPGRGGGVLCPEDRILLGLSFSLALFTFLRCLSIYRVVSSGAYEVVEGVCVELKHKTFQKQQNVLLMSLDGVEHRLTLDKRTHLRIGNRYRFYFKPADTAYVDGLPQTSGPKTCCWAWRIWVGIARSRNPPVLSKSEFDFGKS